MTQPGQPATPVEQYAGKIVLVTGGSGYIGTPLCAQLEALGARVHSVSRHREKPPDTAAQWLPGDLSDIAFARSMVRKIRPQIIFHLASEVSGQREPDMVLPTFRANLESSVNTLLAATETGCERLVLVGSMEEPVPDEGPMIPCSPYAASKLASTQYGQMFHALYRTPVVIARLFMVYGPGRQAPDRLIPHVVRSLLRGETPKIASGDRPVDWIYIDDAVTGLLHAGLAGGIEGRTVDIGTGRLVTTGTIAAMLCALVDPHRTPAIGAVPNRPMERVRTADAEETLRLIGWQSRISVEQGLAETLSWYRREMDGARMSGESGSDCP